MNKSQFQALIIALTEVLKEAKVSKDTANKILDVVKEKAVIGASKKVDLESVVKRDKDGNIEKILCNKSNIWLPATTEFFYEALGNITGVEVSDTLKLRRLSRQAEKISKQFNRVKNASITGLTQDLKIGKITREVFVDKLEKIENSVPDYSTMATTVEELEALRAQ